MQSEARQCQKRGPAQGQTKGQSAAQELSGAWPGRSGWLRYQCEDWDQPPKSVPPRSAYGAATLFQEAQRSMPSGSSNPPLAECGNEKGLSHLTLKHPKTAWFAVANCKHFIIGLALYVTYILVHILAHCLIFFPTFP